jgi:hypothetical protein
MSDDENQQVCSISMLAWKEIPKEKRFKVERKKGSVIYHADHLGSWVFEMGHGTYPHSRSDIEKNSLKRLLQAFLKNKSEQYAVKYPIAHFYPRGGRRRVTVVQQQQQEQEQEQEQQQGAALPAFAMSLEEVEFIWAPDAVQQLADLVHYFNWTLIGKEIDVSLTVHHVIQDGIVAEYRNNLHANRLSIMEIYSLCTLGQPGNVTSIHCLCSARSIDYPHMRFAYIVMEISPITSLIVHRIHIVHNVNSEQQIQQLQTFFTQQAIRSPQLCMCHNGNVLHTLQGFLLVWPIQ